MRVTLSYSWTDPDGTVHPGGETLDVSDLTGRQLLRDGKAREAVDTSLNLGEPQQPAPVSDSVPVSPAAAGYPGPTIPKEK